MPIDTEPNPDLYRGDNLTVDALADRMGEIGGIGVNFHRQTKGLESHFVPMTRFGRSQSIVTRKEIFEVIGSTLVGNRFLYSFDSATGVLAVKSPQGTEGVAVYHCGTHTLKEEGTYRTEPYVSVEGFGISNLKHSGIVLMEIARQTIATAERIAQTLEQITGRLNEEYRPTVMMNAHNNLRPTLPAAKFNMQLAGLIKHLQTLESGEPRMGTGFGQMLEDILFALKELSQEHPQHAVAQALNGIREFTMIEQYMRLGADEQAYKFAQRVVRATLVLLTAMDHGVKETFEQLHPGNCGRPVEMTAENAGSSGEFSLSLENDKFPIGSVTFTPESVQDRVPKMRFHCYGDDATSDLAAAALKHATHGAWWQAQLRG